MSVVVEPSVPFSSSVLDLENPHRWNALLPLIRPSMVRAQTAKGQTILIDTARLSSRDVRLAVVGRLGNFSSKLLDEKNVTAIVTEQQGAGVLTAKDIAHSIQLADASNPSGVVVVRSGKQQRIDTHGSDLLEVETSTELECDHLLHVLQSAKASCRTSIHQMIELIKIFQKSVSSTHSRFEAQKLDNGPSLRHVDGSREFHKAQAAVEKDLEHILSSQMSKESSDVYTVHYSDVNGLSRLENYVLAAELGSLLQKRALPHRISHSTILDHAELARGFSISVCAIPNHYITAQSPAETHQSTTNQSQTAVGAQTRTAVMSFSDPEVRRRITAGCEAVNKEEPTITQYDTIVGDGDCGYTLRDGAKQVLDFIKDKDLAQLPLVVHDLVQTLEVNMGGTSGALYCIYLTALASSLAEVKSIPGALQAALQELLKYTRARVGDRTMMDALIPFVNTLEETGDVQKALTQARNGVDGTKQMEAKLGRSSYLDESATQGVPDPGAYGLLVLLEGMSS